MVGGDDYSYDRHRFLYIYCKNRKCVRVLYRLLATLALIAVHSRVTHAGLSYTPLQCACTCQKGRCFCTEISVPCNMFKMYFVYEEALLPDKEISTLSN